MASFRPQVNGWVKGPSCSERERMSVGPNRVGAAPLFHQSMDSV